MAAHWAVSHRKPNSDGGDIEDWLGRWRGGQRWLFEPRHRVQQLPCISFAWRSEHLTDRPLLDDPPLSHYRDSVGESRHHSKVVRDEDHGHGPFAFQIREERENLRLDGNVQSRSGLVSNQQPGLACQGDREHHSLSHSS